MVSIIAASLEYLYFTKFKKIDSKLVYKITKKRINIGIFCGISFFLWISGLLYAANNTIQAHAYIFNNFGGTFIVIGCIFIGKKIDKLEIIGSAIALTGAFVTLYDGSAQTTDGKKPSLAVNMIDLASSGFGAIYFTLILKLKPIGPLFFSISIVQVSATVFGAILMIALDSTCVTEPFNPVNGLLSVYVSGDFWLYFLFVGILTGHFISICYFTCS